MVLLWVHRKQHQWGKFKCLGLKNRQMLPCPYFCHHLQHSCLNIWSNNSKRNLRMQFNSFHILLFSLAILPSFHQLPHSIVLLPSSAGCNRGPHKRWGKIYPWKTLQEQICPVSWWLFNGYLHATWQCAKDRHTSCTTWAGNCLFVVDNQKILHSCRTS